MAITGYSLTLVGSTSGAMAGVKNVSVGGLELDFDEIATVSDTNRVVENLPTKVREQAMEVTFKYTKAIYNTLRTALLAQTSETWTLTDSESSTEAGTGYVRRVGGKVLGTDGHAEFTASIQPQTKWTFTAG